jgi:hypothetical protein
VTSVFVEAWGGGGGGGGNIAVVSGGDETCTGAGGGAGGGYASRTYTVTPGESYTIVVGSGGSGGAAGVGTTSGITTPAGNGGTGQSSTFSGPATVGPGTLTGTGGNGGSGAGGRNTSSGTCLAISASSGTGNLGLNGTTNYRGGNGAAGLIANFGTDRSGGGGGAAGPSGDGGDAPSAGSFGVGVNPAGGTGILPGGNGGNGRTYNTLGTAQLNGGNGSPIGGGGGGSLVHINTFGVATAVGGSGGNGEVRLTFAGCPLPIELVSFKGKCTGRLRTFEWTTASETNNDFFTLEKSKDGTTFEIAKIIPGAGTSSITNYYTTELIEFESEFVYYRLKQTDYDGKCTYSNIINIPCSDLENNTIIVYPNPANDKIIINFAHTQKASYQLEIYNDAGQRIYHAQHEKQTGEAITIPLNVSSGQYIIRVTELATGTELTPAKFQVIH